MQASSSMIGRKAFVDDFLCLPSNSRAQLWPGDGNYKLGYDRIKETFWWSNEMHKDQKENQ